MPAQGDQMVAPTWLMMLRQYSVVVHTDEDGGYWVEVPALPGCYSQGESVDEALSHVREAIELYLETLRGEGHDVPRDEDVVFKVAVTA